MHYQGDTTDTNSIKFLLAENIIEEAFFHHLCKYEDVKDAYDSGRQTQSNSEMAFEMLTFVFNKYANEGFEGILKKIGDALKTIRRKNLYNNVQEFTQRSRQINSSTNAVNPSRAIAQESSGNSEIGKGRERIRFHTF